MLLAPGEDEHPGAPVPGDLEGDVGRGPEAVEPESPAPLEPAHRQGPVSDDPRAHERRGFLVAEPLAERRKRTSPAQP